MLTNLQLNRFKIEDPNTIQRAVELLVFNDFDHQFIETINLSQDEPHLFRICNLNTFRLHRSDYTTFANCCSERTVAPVPRLIEVPDTWRRWKHYGHSRYIIERSKNRNLDACGRRKGSPKC